MFRRTLFSLGLVSLVVGLGGCFTLDFDEDVRMINHYGGSIEDAHTMFNKYFMDYDRDNPFESG